MKRPILLLLVGLLGLTVRAQTNLDSLYALWQETTEPDSIRVYALTSYIWLGYTFTRPDSAIILSEWLHRFNEEHNNPQASAYGYHIQGVASCYLGDYPAAIDYYRKTLATYEELGDKKGVAASLNNIGNIHEDQGNYSLSLDYYERAVALFEEIGNTIDMAITLGNIGLNYNALGKVDLALEYNQEALLMQEEIEDNHGKAMTLKNIGHIYNDQGDHPSALSSYVSALDIFEKLQDKNNIAESMSYIGIIYEQQGRSSLALDYCRNSLELAEEVQALNSQIEACQCIYDTFKGLGMGNEALEYLEKLRVLEDELDAQETTRKLEKMEFARVLYQDSIAKLEEARRVEEAHQLEVRRKNQTRNVLLGSTLLFVLLASGFYSRWRYVRKTKAIIEKEKDRSENLLLNILPAEIAEELKEKGRAEARDFEMASILFSDFQGFTRQSEQLSASVLVNEINHCFRGFDAIMEKYGIEKIKTIGDAYMAAGGIPVPSDDSVKNTVLAALEMQAFIADRKATNDAAGLPKFEMRVGIHTGPIVAGIVGVKKFQYDIWGDTVNTANRMESSGEVGKVNISQDTYALIKDDVDFVFEKRGKIEAKGKGKIEMYYVSNA